MAGVITTGNHPKALWPGMHAFFGFKYKEKPMQWTSLFEQEKSSKNYEEDTLSTGFGLAPVKNQGGSVHYDTESQGFTKRYTHVVYGLGYIVTQEELEDNQYEELSRKRIRGLTFSHRQSEEIVHANIFNRAFSSSYTGGDAKELIATDHPTLNGSQSNELAVAADFSEAALEDILIQIRQAKNDRGLRIALQPQKLVIPNSLMFDAERVLKSELRSGTANNDMNAVRGKLPGGIVVNDYFTDTDAWFVLTDCPNGLMHFTRRPMKFTQDNDFDTENAKAKSTHRYSVGWTDWRAAYGSEGA